MKKLLLLPLMAAVLSSCSSKIFYQVYKTESTTVTSKTDNAMAYEDDRCRVEYNLWADEGEAGFTFYNKTDEVLKLRLDESFYVLNAIAHDYYGHRVFEDSRNTVVTATSNFGYGRFGWISMYGATGIASGNASSVSVTEAPILAIPPKTAKHVSEYKINQVLYRDCDLFRFPSARKVTTKNFTATASPLQFYNLIIYTLGTSETRQSVKNDFAVTAITNYPQKVVLKRINNEFCGEKEFSQGFMVGDGSPDKFYLKYVKVEGIKH